MDQVTLDPAFLAFLQEILASLKGAYALGGYLAVIPAALMAVVNLYKLPFLQGLLPEKYRWPALPLPAQLAVVFGFSFAGAFGSAVLGGVALGTALVTALGAGVAAIFMNKFGAKPLAGTMPALNVAAALPSAVSKGFSLIVPVDAAKVAELRAQKAAK